MWLTSEWNPLPWFLAAFEVNDHQTTFNQTKGHFQKATQMHRFLVFPIEKKKKSQKMLILTLNWSIITLKRLEANWSMTVNTLQTLSTAVSGFDLSCF